MSQATTAAEKPRSPWIVSPSWDLAYVVATPLLILPIVTLLAHRVFSPEQISLIVVAFASIGHHLPGFMRCYGDRELFDRFRWRFILAPPILFVVCSTFVFNGLHGLELIVLFWATWHGLMQIYGFMRIYDMKRGIRDPLTARLDLFLCFMLFAAGLLCSDARVYSIMELFWLSGLPPIDPIWLKAVRIVVMSVTALAIVAFLIHEIWLGRSKTGVSWPKILLALTTGFIYWSTGTLSTNMLIGVAMFEIFHAVQYYAIVWIYNRKLADRAGQRSGFIGFLFRDRWVFVGLYLAAIAAFGSIQWFSDTVHDPVAQRFLIAFLSASAILHFYYDGFIWKVRERDTQQNLDIEGASSNAPRISVPAAIHVGKWGFLLAIAGLLFGLELKARAKGPEHQQQILARLQGWTPNVPELQVRLAKQAINEGEVKHAIELAREALHRRPRSHEVHAILANALRHSGRLDEATGHFHTAIDLAPHKWENHLDLGLTLVELERWNDAKRSLEKASRLEPSRNTMDRAWARYYTRRGDPSRAMRHLQAALERNPDALAMRMELVKLLSNAGQHDAAVTFAREGVTRAPNSADAQVALGQVLNRARRFQESLRPLQESLRIDPNRAEAYYESGLALVQIRRPDLAIAALRQALTLAPNHADTYFQLGNALYLSGDTRAAAESFQACLDLDPANFDACNSLGAMLTLLKDMNAAHAAYQKALELRPDHADTHYNLGLLYDEEGKAEQARKRFQRAWELGVKPSGEISAAYNLTQPNSNSSGS